MPRPRGDIEHKLLAAARALFLKHGFAGVSLREVARGADTSIGMIHYYHRTKEALFLAVVEETYARLLADLEKRLAPEAPFATRLERLYERLGDMSVEEWEMVRLIVRELLTSSDWLEPILKRFMKGHIPLLLRLVADGQREGVVRKDLNPLVALGSLLGVGVIPTIMRKVAVERVSPGLHKAGLPLPLRMMAKAVIGSLPSKDDLPLLLRTLALDAVSRKR